MSRLMLSSSVLLKWIETPDGDKEHSDLFLMIDGLKDSILEVVKVQASLGYSNDDVEKLQKVNEIMVGVVESLEELFNEVQDQFESVIQKGGSK